MTWNSAAVASQRMWRISSPTARMWWGFQKIDITKWKLACASLWNCLLKCVAAAPSSNTINASHSLWLRYDLRPLFVWQDYTTLLHNSWVWHWGCLCLTSLLVICFRWVFLLPVFNIIWALMYLSRFVFLPPSFFVLSFWFCTFSSSSSSLVTAPS